MKAKNQRRNQLSRREKDAMNYIENYDLSAISTTSISESNNRPQLALHKQSDSGASLSNDMQKSSRSTGTSATPITRNVSSIDDENLGNYHHIDDIEKQNKQRAKYVQKEQRIRLEQLEKENKSYMQRSSPFSLQRIHSIDIQISTETDSSFDHKEWTPQDSSYGAAFPFCGWIPKHIRELAEKVLVGFALSFVFYMMISTAIKLTSSSNQSDNGQSINLDDDFYVSDMQFDDNERNAYNQHSDDDDDLFDDVNNNYYYGGRR